MQAAYHMDFGDPKRERFPHSANDFINRRLEGVRIALFCGKSAKLARKNADVGVIDVTVMNVSGVVTVFSLAQNVSDHSRRVEVMRAVKRDRIGLSESLGCLNFLGDRPEFLRDKF